HITPNGTRYGAPRPHDHALLTRGIGFYQDLPIARNVLTPNDCHQWLTAYVATTSQSRSLRKRRAGPQIGPSCRRVGTCHNAAASIRLNARQRATAMAPHIPAARFAR